MKVEPDCTGLTARKREKLPFKCIFDTDKQTCTDKDRGEDVDCTQLLEYTYVKNTKTPEAKDDGEVGIDCWTLDNDMCGKDDREGICGLTEEKKCQAIIEDDRGDKDRDVDCTTFS